MVLDSVSSDTVSFSENHAFYCLTVHDEYITMDIHIDLIQNN